MVSRVLAAELLEVSMADTYGDLVRQIASRRKELGLTSLDVDDLAGLPDGYVSKLECYPARHHRTLGIVSLPVLMQTLGLRLAVVKVDLPTQVRELLGARPQVSKGGAADDR